MTDEVFNKRMKIFLSLSMTIFIIVIIMLTINENKMLNCQLECCPKKCKEDYGYPSEGYELCIINCNTECKKFWTIDKIC